MKCLRSALHQLNLNPKLCILYYLYLYICIYICKSLKCVWTHVSGCPLRHGWTGPQQQRWRHPGSTGQPNCAGASSHRRRRLRVNNRFLLKDGMKPKMYVSIHFPLHIKTHVHCDSGTAETHQWETGDTSGPRKQNASLCGNCVKISWPGSGLFLLFPVFIL